MAPPRLVKAAVIATDADHDVALLRAMPNPFEGKYEVRFLRLAVQRPARAQSVLAAALRPSRLKDPHTFDAFAEDRPAGEVVKYEFWQLDKGRADTELLLFNHDVLPGDSGAPLVSAESLGVFALIEGRWLRADAAAMATASRQLSSGVGAAIPIHYAIPLLQQQGVAWHEDPQDNAKIDTAASPSTGSHGPVPISLIGAPHPSQALQGGEVVLDAMVHPCGQLDDVRVVQGAPPFLEKASAAVRTWSFKPRAPNEPALTGRLGIVFQFVSPGFAPGHSPMRRYQASPDSSKERAGQPLVTTELEPSANAEYEASIILFLHIDSQGRISSTTVWSDPQSLAPSLLGTIRQWQFSPGKCGGANCDSTVILVVVPRQVAMHLLQKQ